MESNTPVFTGKYKVGEKVRIKDKPGWKDKYSESFRYAGYKGTVMELAQEPGQDYKVYKVQLPKCSYNIISFTEDEIEEAQSREPLNEWILLGFKGVTQLL